MTAREDRLESWKEIAAYLERTSRTCQKWEAQYGLPIHRLDESPKARVYAFKAELDEWLERILHETEAREAGDAASAFRPLPDSGELPPDMPAVSLSAVANKAYWAGRKATERFLTGRNPADLATAVEMFTIVKEADPGNPLAYHGLGDAYRWAYSLQDRKSDHQKLMIKNFARAYELAPGLAETNIGLGWSRYFPGDITAACELFVRAAKLKPDDPDVNLEIGEFLIGLGHLDRAVRRFTRLLAGPTARPRALWLRALGCELMGDYATALADATKALELEPTSGYLRCVKARLTVLTGNLAEAEAELSIAEALSQGRGDVEFTKALLWTARGDRKKAENALGRPARASILRNYVITMIHAALGDLDETIDLIAGTIEKGLPKQGLQAYPYPFLANPNNHFYDLLRLHPRFIEIQARQKLRYDQESACLGDL